MTLKKFSRTELLCSFFNKEIYQEVKANKDIVQRYYYVKEKDNPLVEKLLHLIFTADYIDITPDKIKYVLSGVPNLVENEISAIFGMIKKYVILTDNEILSDVSKFLRQVCSSQAIQDAQHKAGDDTEKFIEELAKYEYRSEYSDEMKIVNFNQLDSNKECSESFVKFCNTENDVIRKAYPSVEAWLSSQMIMFVGEPGGGKSLLMMESALEMLKEGKRVLYVALGDLVPASFIIRMGAQLTGIPLDQAARRSDYCTQELLKAFDDRLMISCVPANKISIEKFMRKVRANRDSFDAIFIDYDSNFKPKGDLGLYLEGGELYSDLSELTIVWKKWVGIGSQPKQGYWGKPFLPKSSAGESSRKQHFVDGIFTIGKLDNQGLPMGKLSFVKNRNGRDNVSLYYIRTEDGRFRIVPTATYRGYKDKDMESISWAELKNAIDKEHAFEAENSVKKFTSVAENEQFYEQASS